MIDERIGDSQTEKGIVTDINKEEYTIHFNMREETSSLIEEMNQRSDPSRIKVQILLNMTQIQIDGKWMPLLPRLCSNDVK